jgi:hypothetical protein
MIHLKDFSWEADIFSAGQEITLILFIPIIHYRVHKIPVLDSVLRQIN